MTDFFGTHRIVWGKGRKQRPYNNRANVRQFAVWSKQRGGTIQDVRGTSLKFYGYAYNGDFNRPSHGLNSPKLAALIVRQTIGNGTKRNTGARRNLLAFVKAMKGE